MLVLAQAQIHQQGRGQVSIIRRAQMCINTSLQFAAVLQGQAEVGWRRVWLDMLVITFQRDLCAPMFKAHCGEIKCTVRLHPQHFTEFGFAHEFFIRYKEA